VGSRSPSGFKIERYARVWERNPFSLVTPATAEKHVSPFDNLFLQSWLKDGSKEMILVQNSETNELQRITTESNQSNLRLVEIRSNPNPQLVEAVISDGKEQRAVKFRFDVQSFAAKGPPLAAGQVSNPNQGVGARSNTPPPRMQTSQSQSSGAIAPANQVHAHAVYPGIPRVHSEGGAGLRPAPRRTRGEQVSPDSPPGQSVPSQS
jgi:hypothetical protein